MTINQCKDKWFSSLNLEKSVYIEFNKLNRKYNIKMNILKIFEVAETKFLDMNLVNRLH